MLDSFREFEFIDDLIGTYGIHLLAKQAIKQGNAQDVHELPTCALIGRQKGPSSPMPIAMLDISLSIRKRIGMPAK